MKRRSQRDQIVSALGGKADIGRITLLGGTAAALPLAQGRALRRCRSLVTSANRQRLLMQAGSLVVQLLLSFSCAMLAPPALSEDASFGPLPALAPGQAPPLPQAGSLAEQRTSDQVAFPRF